MKALKYKYWEVTEDGRVLVSRIAPKAARDRAIKKLIEITPEPDKNNSVDELHCHDKPGYNELYNLPF